MRKILVFTLCAVVLILLGCTDQEKTRCDVILELELEEIQAPYVDISLGAPPAFSTMNVLSIPKNPSALLSDNQDVEVDAIVSKWSRADGGSITPKDFILHWTVVVPAGGSANLSGPPAMAVEQLMEMPFIQLLPENGGRDMETGNSFIICTVEVTVYGHTLNGCDIESQHATCTFQFYYGGGR
jgi:hypothetical protein